LSEIFPSRSSRWNASILPRAAWSLKPVNSRNHRPNDDLQLSGYRISFRFSWNLSCCCPYFCGIVIYGTFVELMCIKPILTRLSCYDILSVECEFLNFIRFQWQILVRPLVLIQLQTHFNIGCWWVMILETISADAVAVFILIRKQIRGDHHIA
jgi:hypothetical protein